MAIRGNSITINYVAWNTSTNTGQTGDVANHTLRWIKDGTAAAPTNSPAEVDAVNAKGVYKLTLTAAEMTCDAGTLAGVSSTANVVIIPISVTTEHGVLPNVQQGNAGAVITSGTGTAQLNVSGGIADANTKQWAGDGAGIAVDANHLPKVDTEDIKGAASVGGPGSVGIDWAHVSNPATVLNLSGTTISAISGAVGSVTAGVTVGTNNDKTGYSLAAPDTAVLQSGTAQAGAASTITLSAGASATDNLYLGCRVKIYGGTGAGQSRTITGYVGATKVATVDRAWTTNPDATSTYAVVEADNPALNASLQVTAASVVGSVGSVTGSVTVGTNNDKTGYSLSGTQTFNLTGNITGNLSGSVGSVTGAVGSVTGNIGGDVTGKVLGGGSGTITGPGVQPNDSDESYNHRWFVSLEGSDTLNAGTSPLAPFRTWQKALSVATAGDLIQGTSESFSETGNLVVPAKVTLRGMGQFVTIINLDSASSITINSGARAADLTLNGNATHPLITTSTTTADVSFRNVFLSGQVSDNANILIQCWFTDCILQTSTSCVAISNGNTRLAFRRCDFISATGATPSGATIPVSTGRVDILDCHFNTAASVDIAQSGTGVINVTSDCCYLESKTSGSITVVPSRSNVALWRDAQPNTLQASRIDSYVGAMAANIVDASQFTQAAADKVWSSAARTLTAFAFNITVGGYAAGQDPYTLVAKTQMVESYTQGAFTLEQALYEIAQTVGQNSVSGLLITAQKRDKTNIAATWTIDNATDPTLRSRAS